MWCRLGKKCRRIHRPGMHQETADLQLWSLGFGTCAPAWLVRCSGEAKLQEPWQKGRHCGYWQWPFLPGMPTHLGTARQNEQVWRVKQPQTTVSNCLHMIRHTVPFFWHVSHSLNWESQELELKIRYHISHNVWIDGFLQSVLTKIFPSSKFKVTVEYTDGPYLHLSPCSKKRFR